MKYVALLSGGKDSCYNLLHCARNGHELVAAASLGPEHGKVYTLAEELDSYLYQTVGQDAIEFVAQALDVPLYRRVISGAAVEQGSEYGGREPSQASGVSGDETEDLYALLSTVKRDQAELLAEMIEAGMEAILIKVAGIGLSVKHLGKTLAEMQPELIKLVDNNNNCPLFKRRIQLTETETVIHSDNDFATVAYLRIKNATLEDKHSRLPIQPTVPSLLSEAFEQIHHTVHKSLSDPPIKSPSIPDENIAQLPKVADCPTIKRIGQWVAIADISVISHLKAYDLQLSHCTNINIFLSSMDLFAQANAVYATFFGTSPPARACVAVDLPSPTSPADRQALHVQGLSYWAPANIGPYSQAIVVNERIFVSGQIGLIPSNLTLPSPPSLETETALSFQHVDRVVSALKNNSGGGWEGHEQGIIYWLARESDIPHVKIASEIYEKDASASILFVTVPALPKGALVEKQVLLHTGRCLVPDEDDVVIRSVSPSFQRGDQMGRESSRTHWEISYFDETASAVTLICFRGDEIDVTALLTQVPELSATWTNALSVRHFYRHHTTISTCTCMSHLHNLGD
ncbi:hypothetical protein IEO21_02861 [Rhodonia placenta]|uniref:Diphthine--ammonia ligase n=1 Tax=Rhodonia placenta TaxID=104341 RepID=A0A8H7U4T5_9APHY|nr:hypothetical protein IEO21_02861 [Postia placenta]